MEIYSVKSAISFLAVASLVSAMTAFQFKTGQCPEVDEMKHFDMNRFLGVWHIIQGTITGAPAECISLNVTKTDSNTFNSIQLPHNISSSLLVRDENQSRMSIQLNATLVAGFDVLVTDYDNFAGFLICRNDGKKNFFRAAAILSRTKSLGDDDYSLVKKTLIKNGISDDDLTVIVTCN